MKRITFFAIAVLLAIVVVAQADGRGKPASTAPNLSTSCDGSGCNTHDAVTFMGSGFKANTTMTLSIDGANANFTILVTPGRDGTFDVSFASLYFPPDHYSITAWGTKGKSIITFATHSFDVN